MSEWVFDVDEKDFERAVIERSRQVPVVVDFWAPWCGPCRTLGPLLERLTDEHGGTFVLAKVNVDESPGLASAFGARSIPMVLGLRDGQVAAEFVGALPETGVREFLARLLPSVGEQLAAEGTELYAAGKKAEAEAAFRQALETDRRSDEALVGLARLLAEREEKEEALELLDRVLPGTAFRQEADRLAASIRVQEADTGDVDELRSRVARDAADLESRFQLAQALAARGAYEEALQNYLAIVERNREFRDDGARRAILDIFELLGVGDELAERYRSELAKVLFR